MLVNASATGRMFPHYAFHYFEPSDFYGPSDTVRTRSTKIEFGANCASDCPSRIVRLFGECVSAPSTLLGSDLTVNFADRIHFAVDETVSTVQLHSFKFVASTPKI